MSNKKQTHLTICENCEQINSSNNMIKCIHQDCDTYVHPICPIDNKDNSNYAECRKCALDTGINFITNVCIHFILIFVGLYTNAQYIYEYIESDVLTIRLLSVIGISLILLFMITYRKFIPCNELPSK